MVAPNTVKLFITGILIQATNKERKDTEKAFGGCKKCYGKGYGTQTLFARTGIPDFGPWDGKKYQWKLPSMVFCSCSRGKQLMKLWHEGEAEIIKKILKNGSQTIID